MLCLPALLFTAGCNNNAPVHSDHTTNQVTNPGYSNADNSARNARDRDTNSLTPGDQGSSNADIEITKKIRQAVVSGTNDYSMTAKNIKIITTNGKVTLRGPVNNDGEKTGIEGIAKSVAGDENVDNQLEIKTNP